MDTPNMEGGWLEPSLQTPRRFIPDFSSHNPEFSLIFLQIITFIGAVSLIAASLRERQATRICALLRGRGASRCSQNAR